MLALFSVVLGYYRLSLGHFIPPIFIFKPTSDLSIHLPFGILLLGEHKGTACLYLSIICPPCFPPTLLLFPLCLSVSASFQGRGLGILCDSFPSLSHTPSLCFASSFITSRGLSHCPLPLLLQLVQSTAVFHLKHCNGLLIALLRPAWSPSKYFPPI